MRHRLLGPRLPLSPENFRPGYSGTEIGLGADSDIRHVILRHVDVDPQLAGLGNDEQRRSAAVGIDQRAEIGVARGDKAVERRGDALVFFQDAKPVEIGLRRSAPVPSLLAASAARWSRSCFDTAPDPMSCCPRCNVASASVELACALASSASRLHDLLIEIGRIDFGEEVAGFDRSADVGLPVLDVATDAGVDLRLGIGFEPAGQLEVRSCHGIRRRDGDDWNRLVLGPFAELGVCHPTRCEAHDDDDAGDGAAKSRR